MSATTDDAHEYRPGRASDSRSPCPALNALANHGYISRDGANLTFTEVLRAIVSVYNFSYPLAFLLTLGAFVTSAKLSYGAASTSPSTARRRSNSDFPWTDHKRTLFQTICKMQYSFMPRITFDLAALSHRGRFKIAHDASFVHPNSVPSTATDAQLLSAFLEFASSCTREEKGRRLNGIGLPDIARFHAQRLRSAPSELSALHMQVTLGECSLTWLVLRGRDAAISVARLRQWFGEERLPDGWWDGGVRPAKTVGLVQARGTACLVGRLTDSIQGPIVELEEEGYWPRFARTFTKSV